MSSDGIVRKPPQSVAAKVISQEAEFAVMLPAHIRPGRWTRLVASKLRQNPDLMKAAQQSPDTLWAALQEAAQLGLQPGTDEYYLTPRRVNKRPAILGIVGYQGEIELMFRAGAVASVIVETVHVNDGFHWVPGQDTRPRHEVDWFGGDRGDVIGAYAYAVMAGTGAISKVVVIGPAEIRRAQDASATAGKGHSPWATDYAAMVKKTAVHQLAKWVPTSSEYRTHTLKATMQAAADVVPGPHADAQPATAAHVHTEPPAEPEPAMAPYAAPAPPTDTDTGEIYEAELVPDPPVTDQPEPMNPEELS